MVHTRVGNSTDRIQKVPELDLVLVNLLPGLVPLVQRQVDQCAVPTRQ